MCKVDTQGGSGLDASILCLPKEAALGGSAGGGGQCSERIKGAGGQNLPAAQTQQRLLTAVRMASFIPRFQRVKEKGHLIALFDIAYV